MTTHRFRSRGGLLAAALVATLSPARAASAAAEDEPGKDTSVNNLIQQGITLRRSGRDEAALALFLEADRRAPNSARILLHVTTAAQASGKWLLAHEYFQKALAHRDEPYYQRYASSIRAIEDTIAQHVGQIRVLGSPAGADVSVNGAVVGRLPMEAPIALEVGSYQLEVSKPGYFPLRRPVTVSAGLSTEAVDLSVVRYVPQPRTPGAAASLVTVDAPATGDAAGALRRGRWITLTLAAGSAVLLGTGAAALVIRERDARLWNDDAACLSATDPELTRGEVCANVRRDITTAERVAVAAGLAGVGLGAAALVHWLVASPPAAGSRRASLVPVCTAGPSGIGCRTIF